ncbi:hypothetical protein DEJ27_03135 [Curtobacterium sp. MCPF17_018]|uniref:hypothetical protein n=1 Tax=Curtobacterium sp. MCPF17_018 TaxID=2175638 RepID=UPI000DA91DC7|nr:hypothetical protein [Curtobacterium sp. MCPF17_018]PZE71785.1 hypothetical protein DEJ27_03135 [Curtobacterium sp. MCPF17_018]
MLAGILFGVSAAAELTGVLLIVFDIRAARKLLSTRMVRVIDGGHAGTDYDMTVRESSDPVERFLLEGRAGQKAAVVLVILGIIAGTVGNFLTLGG